MVTEEIAEMEEVVAFLGAFWRHQTGRSRRLSYSHTGEFYWIWRTLDSDHWAGPRTLQQTERGTKAARLSLLTGTREERAITVRIARRTRTRI